MTPLALSRPATGRGPGRRYPPARERFWENIALWDDCWIWIGHKDDNGYGKLRVDGRDSKAHHFLLEALPGSGFECDHLCRNRACVRPSHIEIVTIRINTLRGTGFGAVNARKTHCPRGHRYDYLNYQGRRRCRQCHRDESYKNYWKERSRAAIVGSPA